MKGTSHELNFKEVVEEYPDVPRSIIRKIDTALRGVIPTEKALERAKEEGALYVASAGKTDKPMFLFGAVFRDGTSVLGLETYLQQLPYRVIRRGNPYILEVVSARGGGKLWLLDAEPRPCVQERGEPVEEIHFVPIPKYYGKKTSRGTPMSEVVTARFPNSLSITVLHCHFDREKIPCKFCFYATPFFRRKTERHTPESLEDIYETVNEALEEGRWTSVHLVGGSDPRPCAQGRGEPYAKEVEEEIKILKTLQRCFGRDSPRFGEAGKIPVRAIASAFPKEQLRRLADTGLSAYNSHIEVWDEKLFEWICPGKAKYFGRQYWIESILSAVEIFGRGNVSTQLVAGAELAEPYGFKTINEAIESNLECVEFFARYGVLTNFCILLLGEGSVFYQEKQKLPPLEYYVRLAKEINEIKRKYKLSIDFQDYRCPDVDLARLDYNQL